MKRISSAGPSITSAEIEMVSEAIAVGWQDKMSLYINMFESEFSAYVGVEYCLTTAHCTDAIHLAMLAAGIGPGDEVIVPDLTWVASASPITYVGATPIFVDVDPISWCITASEIEKNITPKTKAVVVVDLLGNMPEWDEIISVCKKHKLVIVEDAAEGIGATYKGRKAGTFGDISLFSFNATKLIMAGQGGALCTNNKELFDKAKLYSHHGIDKNKTGKYYWSTVLGYNYNWTNIQAALALAQLRRIDDLIAYKKWAFGKYSQHLGGNKNIQLSQTYSTVNPTYWISVAIIKPDVGIEKEGLAAEIDKMGIDLRPMFYPLSSMPAFSKYINNQDYLKKNPVTYEISKFGVCLPNGNNLSESDILRISEAINARVR
jgi:perosamine synthetase